MKGFIVVYQMKVLTAVVCPVRQQIWIYFRFLFQTVQQELKCCSLYKRKKDLEEGVKYIMIDEFWFHFCSPNTTKLVRLYKSCWLGRQKLKIMIPTMTRSQSLSNLCKQVISCLSQTHTHTHLILHHPSSRSLSVAQHFPLEEAPVWQTARQTGRRVLNMYCGAVIGHRGPLSIINI